VREERWTVNQVEMVGRVKDAVSQAGPGKLFLLGLAIGIGIGVLGGRVAERFRLLDYVAIEQLILEREGPPASRLSAPQRSPFLRPPFQM
jgi:hypothetical protein